MAFNVSGAVQLFPGQGRWYSVPVSAEVSAACRQFADRGLVAVEVEVGAGGHRWNTSLMPKGDGTQFVPLNLRARKELEADVGDLVERKVRVRSRIE